MLGTTELHHGIEQLRPLTTGSGLGLGLLSEVGYLAVMAGLGLAVASRRVDALLRR